MSDYLSSSFYFDFHHDSIKALIKPFQSNQLSDKQKAIELYLKIRDGWRYNPYLISFDPNKSKASNIALKNEGHCIDKSILFIAGLRGLGIPARIHLAKVKNHIGVERLIEKFGTNELTPHGMVNIYIEGKWLKASPAFNIELCQKCNVAPLGFDGEEDSVFQEYDKKGNSFMEYLEDYGHFEDVPFDFIKENMNKHYPMIAEQFKDNMDIKIT